MNDGTMKFYSQYVGDTLLAVEPQDISCIHKLLNYFDENNFSLICLKMKSPIFSTWKFTVRNLLLSKGHYYYPICELYKCCTLESLQ